MPSDLRTLVENLTNDLSTFMRRAAIEEVHAPPGLAIGDVTRQLPGPDRPRATVSKGGLCIGKRVHPGKLTPEQLVGIGGKFLGSLGKPPGARSEPPSAAMQIDAATLRIQFKALISAKKVKGKGLRRGTTYFAR